MFFIHGDKDYENKLTLLVFVHNKDRCGGGLCFNMMVMIKRAEVHFVKWTQTIIHTYALCTIIMHYALFTMHSAPCSLHKRGNGRKVVDRG